MVRVEIQGGDDDDHRFAQAALGFRPGMVVDESQLALALKAVRLTDRFRDVSGRLEATPLGPVALIQLAPWQALKDWRQDGKLPIPLEMDLFPGLRQGMRVGESRLEQFRLAGEIRLHESGYPKAQVLAHRFEEGARLRFEIKPGIPDLVSRLEFKGEADAYGPEKLLKLLKAAPGRTLWTEEFRRAALARIRQRFVKDKRFQGQAELVFAEGGALVLTATPGPIVRMSAEGSGLGFKSLKDLLPLARSERYSPELLDAGARSIVRFLRSKGYLDAEVTHRTEILKGTPEHPEEIRVIYRLNTGARLTVAGVRFERNQEIPSAELIKVADLPTPWLGLFEPHWTTDLIGLVEDRTKNHYRGRGYADVSLRRMPLEGKGGKGTLVLQVKEGSLRTLEAVVLEVPAEPAFKAWFLAESLAYLFAEQPKLVAMDSERVRRYQSDRPGMKGISGTVQELETTGKSGSRTFKIRFDRAIPLLKNDLAQMLGVLRQRLGTLGAVRPVQKLKVEAGAEGTVVSVEIPSQPLSSVRRLVVQGSDETRARAIFQETQLEPGMPMDPERLSKAQAQVGNLGGLEQVDLLAMAEFGDEVPTPWKEGDLFLKVAERSKWIFSSGFGYDKSQGYHTDLGAQRLNVGGMGRTLDFGIRAGDATIQNPTLRKWFPTGEFTRSVDMYRLGYMDPRFAPGVLQAWLPERTQFTAEAAYIEEQRSAYQLRRRRILAGLEWTLRSGLLVQTGYRFERSEVRALPGSGISDTDLALVASIPGRAIISAPYVQVIRDRRDNRLDPTSGGYGAVRFEFANQVFGTSSNSSFVKLDLRQQWNWALGYHAAAGVVSLGLRLGAARPTASSAEDLPLSERFFAGGPGTHRGVEPDSLGTIGQVPLRGGPPTYPPLLDAGGNPRYQAIPLGGQGLVIANLEYRFPVWTPVIWGEVFVDSGQVYSHLRSSVRQPGESAPYPHFRTALGVGLILKVGLPIKLEYAADLNRILGRPRDLNDQTTQLKSLLVSAGFQF